MRPGSVIVDLAVEQGGNCEATVPGETVLRNGVRCIGPPEPGLAVPYHASQLYAKNSVTFLLSLVKNGSPRAGSRRRDRPGDAGGPERHGAHPRVREALGLPLLYPAAPGLTQPAGAIIRGR